MKVALWAEWLKARQALPPVVVTMSLTVVVVLISAGLLLAGGRGNAVADAQLAPFVIGVPWVDLGTIAAVITAAGGLLGSGVMLSWMFGREFTDGAAPRLFASPTPRHVIARAKITIFLCWSGVVAIAVTALTLVTGLALGYGLPDSTAVASLVKLAAVSALTSWLAMPCAWIATVSRGILAPIGTAVGLIVLAQLTVFAGVAAWVPFAAPGAWAGLSARADAHVTPLQLAAVIPVAAVFAWLTMRSWRRLRL